MEVLIILFGGILTIVGYKLTTHAPKFETVKSTSGRTVKFLNYYESRKHKRSKVFGRFLMLIGAILLGVVFLYLVFFNR